MQTLRPGGKHGTDDLETESREQSGETSPQTSRARSESPSGAQANGLIITRESMNRVNRGLRPGTHGEGS